MQADLKIANFLYANRDLLQNTLKYSHEDIGEQLGISRVTVSRALSKLKKQGLIETEYRQITILNPKALFDYSNK
jgi:CRP/FNR family transcriptional regulator